MQKVEDVKIAVVGLGYVGLPLAVEFAKQLAVVGFDINEARVAELRAGHDRTLEVSDEELAARRAEQDARGWKPAEPRPRKVTTALKAYALLATSADKGAVRDKALLDGEPARPGSDTPLWGVF